MKSTRGLSCRIQAKTRYSTVVVFSFLLFLLFGVLTKGLFAQGSEIEVEEPFNLSRTAETSQNPFLVADREGRVHLFWAEDVGGEPVLQRGTDGELRPDLRSTNTIMYSVWDGNNWSPPIDVLVTPRSNSASYPTAVIDDEGYIHVIWTAFNFLYNAYHIYYSSARVDEADSAHAWSDPVILATDPSGTEYGATIAYESPKTLHVLYARVAQGDNPPEPRTVTYIRSEDSGLGWSDPTDLISIPDRTRGASTTRLYVAPDNLIFASWSEWGPDGNGQAIYVARSTDSGLTWEQPKRLAERASHEYEHDWVNLAWLGSERFVATWEGGELAFPQASYSEDGGRTWGPPVERYREIIGENGFTEFAVDSNGTLHAFIAQRRRGDAPTIGLWHSFWLGTNWSEPKLLGGVNPMVNPKAVIVSGNRFVAAWYSSGGDTSASPGDITVLEGVISNAPSVSPRNYPAGTGASIAPEPTTVTRLTVTPDRSPVLSDHPQFREPTTSSTSPAYSLLLGTVSAAIVIVIVVATVARQRQTKMR